jgi:oligosaccharide repeat unit polymerase
MNIHDLFQLIQWSKFLLIFAVIFGSTILIVKNNTYFYFDPAWVTILGLSIGVSLVQYLYFIEGHGEFRHALYIAAAFCSFLLGIKITANIFRRRKPIHLNSYIDIKNNSKELKKLRVILKFLQLLLLLMLIIRASTQGLAIFAPDPEMAKVETNTGGFGLITRIVAPAIIMSLAIGFLFYTSRLITAKKLFIILIPSLLLLLSSGSKGALLSIIVAYAAALAYQVRVFQNFIIPKSGRTIAILIIFLLSYSLLVLLIRGSEETNPMLFAATTMAVRFLAFGDAVYYFFFNDLYLKILSHPISYIWDYMVVPTFAVIRLVDYEVTLGLKISGEMFGMERGGPNPTMFVEGYVYFGIIFGLVYVFFIGVIFQYLRFSAFGAFRKFTAFNYLRFIILFGIASTVPVDMILVSSDIINSLFVLWVSWVVMKIYLLLSNDCRFSMRRNES